MARRTLIIGISLLTFLLGSAASAGAGGAGKGTRDRTAPSVAIAAPAPGSTVAGAVTATGVRFLAPSVVLTTGTFLGGLVHVGLERPETRCDALGKGQRPITGKAPLFGFVIEIRHDNNLAFGILPHAF